MILSRFNTVYRHSVLDILTHYADIPTDPIPEHSPLSTRDPHDYLHNRKSADVTATLLASKYPASSHITNVKLKSLDFDQITISFRHPLVDTEMLRPIPYPAKCSSWPEVEDQLITMAKVAAKARNRSHIRVSGIRYPTSPFNLLLLVLVSLLPLGYFFPDLLYGRFFAQYLPFMLPLQPYHSLIFAFALICHALEIFFFLLPRISYFRVPPDYTLEWGLLCAFDGYESIKRFDAYVQTLSDDGVYYDFTNTDYFL